ncbi:MAG: Txe/YoeB family addiction module toxin [Patescibacteria group bacterium]
MLIKPLNKEVKKQLTRFGLLKKFNKQRFIFESNPAHPGLNTEKLEPKSVGLYSFRIDVKFRAIFRVRDSMAEIIYISKHYQK